MNYLRTFVLVMVIFILYPQIKGEQIIPSSVSFSNMRVEYGQTQYSIIGKRILNRDLERVIR